MSMSRQASRSLEPSLGRAFLGGAFALVLLTAMVVLVLGGGLLLLLNGLSLVRR
jgi:hypothetical protein